MGQEGKCEVIRPGSCTNLVGNYTHTLTRILQQLFPKQVLTNLTNELTIFTQYARMVSTGPLNISAETLTDKVSS